MKTYDIAKAQKLISDNIVNLESATIGMHEDWFWTATEIWRDGKFTDNWNETGKFSGVHGSRWATPALLLTFSDNHERMFPCYSGQSETDEPSYPPFGCLSGPTQNRIPPLMTECKPLEESI